MCRGTACFNDPFIQRASSRFKGLLKWAPGVKFIEFLPQSRAVNLHVKEVKKVKCSTSAQDSNSGGSPSVALTMTLCGWKIFSKGKQKVKHTKVDAGCTASHRDADSAVQVTSVSVSGVVTRDSDKQLKGESPPSSVARAVVDDPCSDWDEQDWTVDGGDDVDGDEGNPRNKCALKPGHSLMDWIRLGSSGLDLSGTKGSVITVSSAELAKHCKQDDAWIAIRGKVYNVTHYMDFHPGGPDELLKGIGKDATKLFEDVHAWVNYEQLLAKCYIGPLRNSAIIDLEPLKPLTKTSSDNSGSFRLPTLPFLQTASAKTSPIKSANNLSSNFNPKPPDFADIVPRFDWIQKTSDITMVFYTKAMCNPGLVIIHKNNTEIEVRINTERTITFIYRIEFIHDVNYPCVLKVSHETGKIELRFVKTTPQLWTNYGKMEKEKLTSIDHLQLKYEVVKRQRMTHDSYAILLKPTERVLVYSPIGYHLSATSRINDLDITRSYTPVPMQYFPESVTAPNIPLLIKSYENGILSKHITGSECMPLRISQPKGSFALTSIREHTKIGLLAAGSGITPILALLQYLLERATNRVEKIHLLFFNKTEEDIWCREILEAVSKKDERLSLRHILSEPHTNWPGETGRVSPELIAPLADIKSQTHVTFCCICGPTPFNDLSEKLLGENGFPPERLHFFQG